jgi:hypothetical protein
MGVESIVFRHEPRDALLNDLERFLVGIGAVPGTERLSYVLAGPDHWLDVLVRPGVAGAVSTLTLRVALTNPVDALDRIRDLLSELLVRFGGRVAGLGESVIFEEMGADEQEQLRRMWLRRRADFTTQFGDHSWPISGAEVFRYLREHGGR